MRHPCAIQVISATSRGVLFQNAYFNINGLFDDNSTLYFIATSVVRSKYCFTFSIYIYIRFCFDQSGVQSKPIYFTLVVCVCVCMCRCLCEKMQRWTVAIFHIIASWKLIAPLILAAAVATTVIVINAELGLSWKLHQNRRNIAIRSVVGHSVYEAVSRSLVQKLYIFTDEYRRETMKTHFGQFIVHCLINMQSLH